MKLIGAFVLCGIACLSLNSCASLGTSTKVSAPEALPKIKTVAAWPIAIRTTEQFPTEELVIPADGLSVSPNDVYGQAEHLSRSAERELLRNLRSTELFRIIEPDTVTAIVKQQDSAFARWSQVPWQSCSGGVDADAFMLTKVRFAGESNGFNTYVTLTLFEKSASAPAVTVSFNTKWGKSYFLPQPVRVTLSDAMEGAVKALTNAMHRAQSKVDR